MLVAWSHRPDARNLLNALAVPGHRGCGARRPRPTSSCGAWCSPAPGTGPPRRHGPAAFAAGEQVGVGDDPETKAGKPAHGG